MRQGATLSQSQSGFLSPVSFENPVQLPNAFQNHVGVISKGSLALPSQCPLAAFNRPQQWQVGAMEKGGHVVQRVQDHVVPEFIEGHGQLVSWH